MFGVVEANKASLNIQEYSIAQTSLEQIFNQFAAQQEEEKGPAAGLQWDNSLWLYVGWDLSRYASHDYFIEAVTSQENTFEIAGNRLLQSY